MDRDELSEAIAKAQNEGLTTLDLSRKGLITLPPERRTYTVFLYD